MVVVVVVVSIDKLNKSAQLLIIIASRVTVLQWDLYYSPFVFVKNALIENKKNGCPSPKIFAL